MCARVRVCPVRQFNVQLYVEKVFIAQKTSEDRGGKGEKALKKKKKKKKQRKRHGIVGGRLTEEELGGGRGRMVGGKVTDGGIYAVAKTHRQTGYNNCATQEVRNLNNCDLTTISLSLSRG